MGNQPTWDREAYFLKLAQSFYDKGFTLKQLQDDQTSQDIIAAFLRIQAGETLTVDDMRDITAATFSQNDHPDPTLGSDPTTDTRSW